MIDIMANAVKSAAQALRQGSRQLFVKSGGFEFSCGADISAHAAAESTLKAAAPHVRLISEENADRDFNAARAFILDPLDGTSNFIAGIPFYAVSLAYAEYGEVKHAAVLCPNTGELFTATAGAGAYLNGVRISVPRSGRPESFLAGIGTQPYLRANPAQKFRLMQAAFEKFSDVRRLGAAALELCFVACGRLGVFAEQGLKGWDYSAAMLIVREAGGVVTDFEGRQTRAAAEGDIASAGPEIHSALLGFIKEVKFD